MADTVLDLLRLAPEYPSLLEGLKKGFREQLVYGLSGSLKSFVAAGVRRDTGRPLLVVTGTIAQAEKVRDDLQTWLPEQEVALFPHLEYLPFEVMAHSPEVMAQRLGVLEALAQSTDLIVVAPIGALQRVLTPASVFRQACFSVRKGERVDTSVLMHRLVRLGYERLDMVEARGQFSLRGGILDLWPVAQPEPARIEFFDDEIDSIRTFDPTTQRSTSTLSQLFVGPAREFILPDERQDGLQRIREDLANTVARLQKVREQRRQSEPDRSGLPAHFAALLADPGGAAERLTARVQSHLEKLEQEIVFEGMDGYATYFYRELSVLLDYFERPPIVVVDEPTRLKEAAGDLEKRDQERQVTIMEKGGLLPGQFGLYLSFQEFTARLRRQQTIQFTMLMKKVPGSEPENMVSVRAQPMQDFHSQWPLFIEELSRWRAQRYRVLVFGATEERAQKLAESLGEEGIETFTARPIIARAGDGPAVPAVACPATGGTAVAVGGLEAGFVWPGLRLVVVTDGEVYGRPKRRRRPTRAGREGARLASYQDLKIGDYVVHVSHGIGKYMGMQTLEINGVQRDYLYIKYDGADRLYVPTEQIDLIQKFMGAEGAEPKVNKLGGNEWSRVKSRVKEAIREMAAELLRLQAIREATPGHAVAADTVWQREFEDRFPYEETPDQLQATIEIKRCQEKARPMDRLLLGDVGYGKTEVAMRAAFKAVSDGKQVAVLVPTTILAQQHFATFSQRFGGFPFKIAVLNRFRSQREQNEILQELARGEIDVVIGTHRLLSADVRFKELGLVIIDEEQRFGVAHKEKLKWLRTTVDVLTMSATPIPRTLHMAMVGVRDMSVITSPPEDRFPVETFVAEYDEELVRDAIDRELHRGGQVYFVHNRVQTIEKAAARVQALAPEARVAVAHGQMKEDRLEKVMLDFMEGEYDVLVCTTIIESGLDIPRVNTIIVDEADHLGLAQLYQLRGRVGRSNRLAYAYFLYRRDKVLTEVAEKRLQAIKDFTELGSGFKIAMRDLEIRGAGNILGPEQHGFIMSVGFDLYCQLLEESVQELKGEEPVARDVLPPVELSIDAYVPDSYILDPRQKINIYKRISTIRSQEDVHDVEEELRDRFGAFPAPVQNLLLLARLRVMAKEAGITSVSQQRDRVTIRLGLARMLPPELVVHLGRRYRGRLSGTSGRTQALTLRVHDWQAADLLLALEDILPQLRERTPTAAGRVL